MYASINDSFIFYVLDNLDIGVGVDFKTRFDKIVNRFLRKIPKDFIFCRRRVVDHLADVQDRVWILFVQVMELVCDHLLPSEHRVGVSAHAPTGKSKVFVGQGQTQRDHRLFEIRLQMEQRSGRKIPRE